MNRIFVTFWCLMAQVNLPVHFFAILNKSRWIRMGIFNVLFVVVLTPRPCLIWHRVVMCYSATTPPWKVPSLGNEVSSFTHVEYTCTRAHTYAHRRAVCKVCGLTLLLPVGTLWRCGDGLFFEVLPLASDALLTTLHPLLENVLQTVDHFEISCLRASFSWLEKSRNPMGQDLNWILCSAWKRCIGGIPLEHPPYIPVLAPYHFWAFPTTKRELGGKKFRSDQRYAARFREVGGAL
jgi:hypothetical protein